MKGIISKLILFAAMALVFSALTGCGGASGNQSTNGVPATGGSGNTGTASTKNSDYPPLAERAVARGVAELRKAGLIVPTREAVRGQNVEYEIRL